MFLDTEALYCMLADTPNDIVSLSADLRQIYCNLPAEKHMQSLS